jgi:hypothetical protein
MAEPGRIPRTESLFEVTPIHSVLNFPKQRPFTPEKGDLGQAEAPFLNNFKRIQSIVMARPYSKTLSHRLFAAPGNVGFVG